MFLQEQVLKEDRMQYLPYDGPLQNLLDMCSTSHVHVNNDILINENGGMVLVHSPNANVDDKGYHSMTIQIPSSSSCGRQLRVRVEGHDHKSCVTKTLHFSFESAQEEARTTTTTPKHENTQLHRDFSPPMLKLSANNNTKTAETDVAYVDMLRDWVIV